MQKKADQTAGRNAADAAESSTAAGPDTEGGRAAQKAAAGEDAPGKSLDQPDEDEQTENADGAADADNAADADSAADADNAADAGSPESGSGRQGGGSDSPKSGSTERNSGTGSAESGSGRKKDSAEEAIQAFIEQMPLEDKIAQLFVLTPEALTGVGPVTKAGKKTEDAVNRHPVGGLVYFAKNIRSEQQFTDMVKNAQRCSRKRTGLPFFICVDEEGGSVKKFSGHGMPGVPDIPDMCQIGAAGDPAAAYEIGKQIGGYLKRFRVNVNFAPVADVYVNAENTVIRKRSFGSDPQLVASMVEQEVRGLKSQGIAAVLKHFPGHGDTAQDSHSQGAYSDKTLDGLRACEWIPFQAGIAAGADFVMAGHISFPKILEDDTPASLSYTMLTEMLREELGFEGIIITDALNMGAVTSRYSSAQAAVLAVEAGADMLLMPQDFTSAYDALLDAVKQGVIKESRIDESVMRICRLKKE